MDAAEIAHSWFNERIARGAVARDTEAFNQVHAALPDLIARIDAAGGQAARAEPAEAVPDPVPGPDVGAPDPAGKTPSARR